MTVTVIYMYIPRIHSIEGTKNMEGNVEIEFQFS